MLPTWFLSTPFKRPRSHRSWSLPNITVCTGLPVYHGYQCTIATTANNLNTHTQTIMNTLQHEVVPDAFRQDVQTPLLTDGKEPLSSSRATCCVPTTTELPGASGLAPRNLCKGTFASQPQQPFRCVTISGVCSRGSLTAGILVLGTVYNHFPLGYTQTTTSIKHKKLLDFSLLGFLLPDLSLTAVLPGDCT